MEWVLREVGSPYGSVLTLHWAVGDGEEGDEVMKDGVDHHHHPTTSSSTQPSRAAAPTPLPATLSPLEMEELTSAEDQLGAVLWNSNTVALNHLDEVFIPPAAISSSSSSCTTKLRGLRVIDLGAGVGCLGIALAMGGAHAIITDLLELLPLMRYNASINQKRIATKSGGVGQCGAMAWKWGTTNPLNIKKLLQRQRNNNNNNKTKLVERDALIAVIVSLLTHTLAEPSAAFEEACAMLPPLSSSSSSSSSSHARHRHHLRADWVVMCDALYGNPKDWPQLLFTLTEMLADNPRGCTIINFCEQRVQQVEGAFTEMLKEENTRRSIFDSVSSSGVMDEEDARRGATRLVNEFLASAGDGPMNYWLLSELVLRAWMTWRRGKFRWHFTTTEVEQGESELNMRIRATRICWVDPSSSSSLEGDAHPLRRRGREEEVVLDASSNAGRGRRMESKK